MANAMTSLNAGDRIRYVRGGKISNGTVVQVVYGVLTWYYIVADDASDMKYAVLPQTTR